MGFAVPGTVSSKPTKKRKSNIFEADSGKKGMEETDFEANDQVNPAENNTNKKLKKTRTKIRL